MQQNRKTCVALYFEDEYEELVVEACSDCKWLDNPICNWPSFQCKFYKVCMKDNNIFFLSQNDELVPFLQGEGAPKDVRNLEQE
jgi:hypothetical protein